MTAPALAPAAEPREAEADRYSLAGGCHVLRSEALDRLVARDGRGYRASARNVDGVDHYGLHPDWIEDLRLVAGPGIVRDMARGAEAYLQMWERAVGVPAERCRPERARFRSAALGALRLGSSPERVLRRAGQPGRRAGRTYRYCVGGAGNDGSSVGAVFERGRLALVATDAPGHRARGVAPGDRSARLRGAKRLRPGLRVDRTGRGTSFVYRVRGGEVRSVAVAARSVARSRERLRRYMRLAT